MLDNKNNAVFWKTWKNSQRKSQQDVGLAAFTEYFKQQQVPPHIPYFDYSHMSQIENLVDEFIYEYGTELDPIDEVTESILDSPFSDIEVEMAMKPSIPFHRIPVTW